MKIENIFRGAIVTQWLATLIGVVLALASLPEFLRKSHTIDSENNSSFVEDMCLYIALPLTLLSIVSSIGLFFYKTWAPPIYIRVTIFLTILIIASRPMVFTGSEFFFCAVSFMASGFVIAMVRFSEIERRFVFTKAG